MAERRADKGSIDGHLGHATGEVVAMLIAILRDPRGEKLLQRCQRAGREHLRPQGVLLQLLQVPLWHCQLSVHSPILSRGAQYCKIAIRTASLGDRVADLVHKVVLLARSLWRLWWPSAPSSIPTSTSASISTCSLAIDRCPGRLPLLELDVLRHRGGWLCSGSGGGGCSDGR